MPTNEMAEPEFWSLIWHRSFTLLLPATLRLRSTACPRQVSQAARSDLHAGYG